MVELEVVGRHALLFDDDAMATFVNSTDALLQWSSLLIDRYDVRHLLQDLPPPVKKRRPTPPLESDGVHRSDLDRERYLDLPPNDDDGDNPNSGSANLLLIQSPFLYLWIVYRIFFFLVRIRPSVTHDMIWGCLSKLLGVDVNRKNFKYND